MKRRKGTGRKCLALLLAAAMILGIVPADGYGKEGDPAAIKTTTVENADNLEYSTEGGNDTEDKVFLLSETDCWGTNAASYGFVNNCETYDEGRRSKTSTYAYAMGTHRSTSTDYAGNCWWWLRSPGNNSSNAA